MIKVIKPGMLTTFQDLGRTGCQKYGVIQSGAMDPFAHRIANLLAGNPETMATMEITLTGPVLEFQADALIAICGGQFHVSINGKPVSLWKPILVKSGSELRIKQAKIGCRAYLAVAGGFSVPFVMKSQSTYLRAKIGGWNGRALQAGDEIEINPPGERSKIIMEQLEGSVKNGTAAASFTVSKTMMPNYSDSSSIRVVKGRQAHLFTDKSLYNFFHHPYKISTDSDRMGYRLKGPELRQAVPEDMLSESVSFGTVQVPPDGRPIVLLADRQTTGGYPKIAQVISADLPLMAQLKPGDEVQFTEISLQAAQSLYIERERKIGMLRSGLELNVKRRKDT
ncbi:biotin-dependent carboxyltransferase family protein [Heyndrickxia acidiproducens]|uniref:5-oxoprolinase subunit C family protein n=1 Tax=Heyndrickxia acidiproducens TaxID=1121084 RepID=UPI00036D9A41|nr:biotin-dependent carboxyltransferase family protein [Heyndrickxia acidiproducens]